MKRSLSILIISVFVLTAGFLGYRITGKIKTKRVLEQRILKLPDFSFPGVDGLSFKSSDIRSGPVLIVRFHPECEHCRYEISEIMKSTLPGSGTQIIMISSAEKDTIKNFLRQFDLSAFHNITTLVDTSFRFGEIFGSNVVPGNFLYDKDLELIKAFNGEVKTETILKYLGDSE